MLACLACAAILCTAQGKTKGYLLPSRLAECKRSFTCMRVTIAACNSSHAAETSKYVPHMHACCSISALLCFAAVLGAPNPADGDKGGGNLVHEVQVYTCAVSPAVEEFTL